MVRSSCDNFKLVIDPGKNNPGRGWQFKQVVQATAHKKNTRPARKTLSETSLGVLFSSRSSEWNTPSVIIEPVLQVLGSVDLDPCSNSKQSPNIPAKRHFVKEDDGLKFRWKGRVYLNPPYGREILQWVKKLHDEYKAQCIKEAIALLPARTDTAWFRILKSYPRCFIHGRLKFGNAKHAAPFPSVVVYLGNNSSVFVREFEPLGDIYTLMSVSR